MLDDNPDCTVRFATGSTDPVLEQDEQNIANNYTNPYDAELLKKDGTARTHKGFGTTAEMIMRDATRKCYSHEYIGEAKKGIQLCLC